MFRFGAAYPGEVCPASARRRSRETIAFLPSVMANPRGARGGEWAVHRRPGPRVVRWPAAVTRERTASNATVPMWLSALRVQAACGGSKTLIHRGCALPSTAHSFFHLIVFERRRTGIHHDGVEFERTPLRQPHRQRCPSDPRRTRRSRATTRDQPLARPGRNRAPRRPPLKPYRAPGGQKGEQRA
jgi:hypothetical protein